MGGSQAWSQAWTQATLHHQIYQNPQLCFDSAQWSVTVETHKQWGQMSIKSTTHLVLLICNINQHYLVNAVLENIYTSTNSHFLKYCVSVRLLLVGHTISSCDPADSVILDLLKMCATHSITLTDVSRQSTELVVCSRVNFVLIGSPEEKIIKCAPKCKVSPLPVNRKSPLVVTNWKSSCVSAGSVNFGRQDNGAGTGDLRLWYRKLIRLRLETGEQETEVYQVVVG